MSGVHLPVLSPATLAAIREFDTCTIANAIERFGVRLRNEGYTRPGLHCLTGYLPPAIGYAATAYVRSEDPPVKGASFLDRTDWWSAIAKLPSPRIAVIQDVEADHVAGSVVGQVHVAILKAFECAAVITNGAVRDIPGVTAMQFPVFARTAAVSHAYVHIVDFGTPVRIFGLHIEAGDLLLVDCHGALSIPIEIAAELPRVAAEIRARERKIIDLCESPDFSAEKLLEAIRSDQ